MQLNYETHGDPARPALLLLHGFMSCNGQWRANIDALTERYFLVLVELWGHGDSPLPDDESQYSLAAYFQQFETLRAKLGIAQWALIGQSYGAGIMLNYAKAYPDVCTAVVATNSRSAFGTLLEDNSDRRSQDGTPQTTPTDLRKLPYHPIHARRFPAEIKAELVRKADAMQAAAVHLGGLLGRDLNCRKLLETFSVPLLITNGKYEKTFQDDLAALRERVADLNVADLEGGHSVNIEAATGFNEAVLEFLESIQ